MSLVIHEEIVRGWPAEEGERFTPAHFTHLAETGSTNDDLLERARAGAVRDFELISADYQTKGRGRRGDRWEATSGRNLLFSLALPLEGRRENWSRLPQLTAALVGSAIEDILGPGHQLEAKWPNDLLFNGKKLAGILVEISLVPRPIAIVGVGINVNLRPNELPTELRDIATSLYEIADCESSRWFLLGLIVQGFIRHYPSRIEDFTPALDWIAMRDFLRGRPLRLRSGREWLEGTASGIGPGGELLLETGEGLTREIVSAEEIQWQ
jgi:BirA family transcriptional regulator, biotin operon repressor / biotin---[acetyl-CoA-carboxylase] ligase